MRFDEYTKDRSRIRDMINEWQQIIDLVTKISGAHVGLIMSLRGEDIEVHVASKTPDNPYKVGDKEHFYNSGLYCERVITTQKELLVENALKSDEWNHNPDLKYDLIAYLGFPVTRPDGEAFGTICLLDKKENAFSPEVIELMRKMRDMIEGQLYIESLLIQNAQQTEVLKKNIQQLEDAYKALKINEEKYRLITENTTDYIWVYNFNKNKFTYASPNVYHMRGYTVDEILEQNFENAVLPDYQQRVDEQVQEAKRYLKEHPESEYIFANEIMQPCKNGESIWVEFTAKCRINHEKEMELVGVSRNITERKLKEKEIYYLSTHDYLTGVLNRSCFEEKAVQEISRAERYKKPLSFIMLDLDYFKSVNDTFGHLIGDETLKQASKVMC